MTQNPYLQKIIAAMQINDLNTALSSANDWLAIAPENSEAYHILGLLLAQQGKFQQAITYFQQAIRLDATQAVYHSNLSNAYKKQGEIERAFQHIHQAIRLKPNYAEAHNNLGSLLYTEARYREAIASLEKAIRLQPQYWEAHYNLANTFVKLNENLKAIEHYLSVLHILPDHQNSIQNLAMVYITEKHYDEALPLLEKVIEWQPNNPEIMAQLGHLYLETGQSQKAIACFHQAISKLPNRSELHHNLAVLLLREKDNQNALIHFKKALSLDPSNDTARHMTFALEGAKSQQAPQKYVTDLFDQYASYYNQHVKEKLHYQAPGQLRQAIGKLLPRHTQQKVILDIGCGTGLCGVFFQDIAKWMVGVDISHHMLLHAKALGAYHALCQMDILQGLPGIGQGYFDLVIAADVMVYLGDLLPIFKLVKQTLHQDGYFAFTIETLPEHDMDYHLQATGRFAHQALYIQKLAKNLGFIVKHEQHLVLRKNEEQDINGMLFIFGFEK